MGSWLHNPEAAWLTCGPLASIEGLRHGMTTAEAAWRLSFRLEPDAAHVARDRAAACARAGVDPASLAFCEQTHGNGVALVREPRGGSEPGGEAPGADALVTDAPGITLAILVADCLPVFFVDPVRRAVGLAHSGWRGTAGRIAEATVERMRAEFGSRPSDLHAAIGPGIRGCCYQVGDEVRGAMLVAGAPEGALVREGEGWKLDLPAVVSAQIVAAGVPAGRVYGAPWCTRCEGWLESYRRRGAQAGRMMALLGMDSVSESE